jgi:hypothetical protein
MSLSLGRRMGKVVVRNTVYREGLPSLPNPSDYYFTLYNDGPGLVTIDPTEMVKRNWMINLLGQALKDRLYVSVSHEDDTNAMVRGVTLYAAE